MTQSITRVNFDHSQFVPDKDAITLVLSTGGVKGVWQAAVLDVLISAGIFQKIPMNVIGGSAGAVNTMLVNRMLSSGNYIRLSKIWKDVILPAYRDGYKKSKRPFNVIKNLVTGGDGLIDPMKLFNKVEQAITELGYTKPTSDHKHVKCYVCAYDMRHSRVILVPNTDTRFEIVSMASAAIPIIMKPIEMNDSVLTDIGVIDPLLYYTVFQTGLMAKIDRDSTFAVVAQKKELNSAMNAATLNMISIASGVVESLLDSLIYHQYQLLSNEVRSSTTFEDYFSHDLMADNSAIEFMISKGTEDGTRLLQDIQSWVNDSRPKGQK